MKNPKFQLYQSAVNKQYYFRLLARNGEIVLGSEGYISRQNAQLGIESVKQNAGIDSRYQRKNGIANFTFNLIAANGEIIGRSENYTSAAARENGISAVKDIAAEAPVEVLP